MSNQALNKKLAEWAGWHKEIASLSDGMRYPVLLAPNEELSRDGNRGYMPDHTPDFTNSLDACFKWLRPKAREKRILFNYTKIWGKLDRAEPPSPVSSYALAFCLAIEKLIDKES